MFLTLAMGRKGRISRDAKACHLGPVLLFIPKKIVLSTCHVPDPVLSAEDTMNRRNTLPVPVDLHGRGTI